jgi:hypothetical protein
MLVPVPQAEPDSKNAPEGLTPEIEAVLDGMRAQHSEYERAVGEFLYNALLLESAAAWSVCAFFVSDPARIGELDAVVFHAKLPMGAKVEMFRNLGPFTSDPEWVRAAANRAQKIVEFRNRLAHDLPLFTYDQAHGMTFAFSSPKPSALGLSIADIQARAREVLDLRDEIDERFGLILATRWHLPSGDQ